MQNTKKSLKYKVGMFFIILGIISPVIGLLVPLLELPAEATTAIVALFMIGGPEIFIILGGALAGKEAMTTIKSKLFAPAGKTRYYIGMYLFIFGVLCNWVLVYLDLSGSLQWDVNTMLIVTAGIDLVTVTGALLAGVEFFSKLWRLFHWEGSTAPVVATKAEP